MSFETKKLNRNDRLLEIANNLRGLSDDKVKRLGEVRDLWTQCRTNFKGFNELYRRCVELGVDLTTEQRVAHLDPIGGNVCITKGLERYIYSFDDVTEALEKFYDLATAYNSDAKSLYKREVKSGRRQKTDATTRRLRSNAKI